MACHKRSGIYNDIQELTDVRKSLENKSPVFVPLNGLSQSAKDRRMNKRTVKPPKNINLIEADPNDNMDFSTSKDDSVLNEYQLSSQIKEANGMDYSNHSTEQYYRKLRSVSPDISEEDVSISMTTESSHSGKYETATCSSFLSNSTGAESFNTENDVLVDAQDNNLTEDDYSLQDIDETTQNEMIQKYSKNVAISSLLRNNQIPVIDLNKNGHRDSRFSSRNKEEIIYDKKDKNNPVDSNSKTDKILLYPYLVPHPEDPEFFTHPLVAYGKLDDGGIDFTVRSNRKKTITTPRQHHIREALNDDIFIFKPNKSDAAADRVPNFSFPSMARSPTIQNENPFGSRPISSHSSIIDQDDDIFVLNRKDFPTL